VSCATTFGGDTFVDFDLAINQAIKQSGRS